MFLLSTFLHAKLNARQQVGNKGVEILSAEQSALCTACEQTSYMSTSLSPISTTLHQDYYLFTEIWWIFCRRRVVKLPISKPTSARKHEIACWLHPSRPTSWNIMTASSIPATLMKHNDCSPYLLPLFWLLLVLCGLQARARTRSSPCWINTRAPSVRR